MLIRGGSAICSREGFLNYKTGSYTLHCFETLNGLKFAITTDLTTVGDVVRADLRQLHADAYTDFVAANPLYVPGEPITSELFKTAVDEFIRARPYFS